MVERRNAVDDDNTQKPRGDLGLTNWTQIFFVVLSIVYVLENYITYGIIKNPVELTILAIEFIQEYWWFVKSAIISYVVSGLLCLIVENGLAANIIPEKYGMAIQIFNSMLPLNIGAILSYLHNVNPVAGVALSTFFFACSIKLLSYCLENQKYRKVFKDSSLAPSAKTKYPQNLTLRDLLVHLCDGGHMYDGRIVRREPRTIKKFARLVFSAIALNYIIAFIVYQYVLPELDLAFHFVTTKHYIGVCKCVFKLTLPIHLVWYCYYYLFLICTFLRIGEISTGNVIEYTLDWWNSINLNVFWSKWNPQVHTFLKVHIYEECIKKGYTKRQSAYAVWFVSGLLHEYVCSLPARKFIGLPTAAMLFQVSLADVSKSIAEKFGKKYGNIYVLFQLIVGHVILITAMYCYTK